MPKIILRPKAGGTRCPFCHDACAPRAAVAVCADCLSRHHQACWSEGAACASCCGSLALSRSPTGEEQDDPWRVGLYCSLSDLGLLIGAFLCLALPVLRVAKVVFETMGVKLPWITKLVVGQPFACLVFVLAPIPLGLLLERKVGLRGAGFVGRALALLALLGIFAVLMLPTAHFCRPLCQ